MWINSCFIGKFSCIIFRVFLVFLHKMSVMVCFVMTCFMTLIILNKSCCLLDSSWGRKGQALVFFIILDSYTRSILCVFAVREQGRAHSQQSLEVLRDACTLMVNTSSNLVFLLDLPRMSLLSFPLKIWILE